MLLEFKSGRQNKWLISFGLL